MADQNGRTTDMARRMPPQSIEAERSVLGGILLDPDSITRVVEIVKADDTFYHPSNGRIFHAMRSLFMRREPIDVTTLSEELKKAGDLDKIGGVSTLMDLLDSVPSAANIEYYAKIVLERYLLRQLIKASTEIASDCYRGERDADFILEDAEQKIFNISEARASKGFVHIESVLKDRFEEIQKVHESRRGVTGLPSGFIDLDKITAGFHPGDLIIIAGRPAMGKTSFALNIAQNVGLAERKPVAIFSLEMSQEQLVQRMLCAEAQVDSQKVRKGFTSVKDIQELTNSATILSNSSIFIDDTPSITTLEMRARARRLKAEHDIALVIIDYLQLARPSERAENRQQEISAISRSLKAMSKELNIPVVSLSQLSRAVETRGGDKKPMLSDLRESGAIEQDADLVLFLYRPEIYYREDPEVEGKAELIIGKHRNGPTGVVHLVYEEKYTRFYSLSTAQVEEKDEVF